jgi:hypothetical protein
MVRGPAQEWDARLPPPRRAPRRSTPKTIVAGPMCTIQKPVAGSPSRLAGVNSVYASLFLLTLLGPYARRQIKLCGVSYQSGSGSMTLERSFGSGGIQRTISVRWTLPSSGFSMACVGRPRTALDRAQGVDPAGAVSDARRQSYEGSVDPRSDGADRAPCPSGCAVASRSALRTTGLPNRPT